MFLKEEWIQAPLKIDPDSDEQVDGEFRITERRPVASGGFGVVRHGIARWREREIEVGTTLDIRQILLMLILSPLLLCAGCDKDCHHA